MLEDVAVCESARVVTQRKRLTRSDDVLDLQPRGMRVPPSGPDRDAGRIDTDDVAAELGELLRHEPAPASDVDGPETGRISPGALEDLPEVAEPPWRETAVEHVERIVLIPPGFARAIIDLVIDSHRPGSFHHAVEPGRRSRCVIQGACDEPSSTGIGHRPGGARIRCSPNPLSVT
jgi:hypothetical protein